MGRLKEVVKRGGFESEIRGVRGDCSGYLAMVQFLHSYGSVPSYVELGIKIWSFLLGCL